MSKQSRIRKDLSLKKRDGLISQVCPAWQLKAAAGLPRYPSHTRQLIMVCILSPSSHYPHPHPVIELPEATMRRESFKAKALPHTCDVTGHRNCPLLSHRPCREMSPRPFVTSQMGAIESDITGMSPLPVPSAIAAMI